MLYVHFMSAPVLCISPKTQLIEYIFEKLSLLERMGASLVWISFKRVEKQIYLVFLAVARSCLLKQPYILPEILNTSIREQKERSTPLHSTYILHMMISVALF